jgi:uncharacterized protein (TIGR02996 family)
MPTLDTDEDAFRKAIAANPRDDAPVLVYADWLDEHGRSFEALRWRCEVKRRHDPKYRAGARDAVPPPLPMGPHRQVRRLIMAEPGDNTRR